MGELTSGDCLNVIPKVFDACLPAGVVYSAFLGWVAMLITTAPIFEAEIPDSPSSSARRIWVWAFH